MAETDKPKPKKQLGQNIWGTAVKKSSQAKTVRPGDENKTGAKVVKPYETMGMEVDKALKSGVVDPSMLGKMGQVARSRKRNI